MWWQAEDHVGDGEAGGQKLGDQLLLDSELDVRLETVPGRG